MDSSFARLFYVDAAGIGCMKRCLPRYSGVMPGGSLTTSTFDPDHVHEAKLQIKRWHKDEWKIQFVFNPFTDLHYNHGFIIIRDQELCDKRLMLRNKSIQQYNLEIWNACYVTIYEEMFSKGRVTFCLGVAQIRTLLRKLESHGRPVLSFPKTKAEKGIVDREIESMFELETEDLSPIPQLFKENGWKFKHYGYCATLWYIGDKPPYKNSDTTIRNLDVCIKYGITVKLRRLIDWEFLEGLLPEPKINSMAIIMASAKSATAQVLNNCTISTKGSRPSSSNWLPTVFDSSISAAQFPPLAPFGIAQKSPSEESIHVTKEISNSPRPSPPPFKETLFLETFEKVKSPNSKMASPAANPSCSSVDLDSLEKWRKKITPFEQQFTRRSSNVYSIWDRSPSPNSEETEEEDENKKSQNSSDAKSKRQRQSKPQAPAPPKISLCATSKHSRTSRSRSRSRSSRRKISSAVKHVSRSRSRSPPTPRRSRYQSPRGKRSRSRSRSRSRRSRWDMSESPEFRIRARTNSSDTNKPSTSKVKPGKRSPSHSPSKSQTSSTDSEKRELNFERISLLNLRPSERKKNEILWGRNFSLKFTPGGRDMSIRPKTVVRVYPEYAKKILHTLETHYISVKRSRLLGPTSIATQTDSESNEGAREKKNKIPKRQDFSSSHQSITGTSSSLTFKEETLSMPPSQEDNGMGNGHDQSSEEGELSENSDREIFDRTPHPSGYQAQKPQPFKKVPQIMSKSEQQANHPKIRINILSNAQKEQVKAQNQESAKKSATAVSVEILKNIESVLLEKASSQRDEISALKIPISKVPENTQNITRSSTFTITSDMKRESVQNSKVSEIGNNQNQSNVEMPLPTNGKKVFSLAALRKLQKQKLEENKKAEEAAKKEEE